MDRNLFKEKLPEVQKLLSDKNVLVWYQASENLIKMLLENTHPIVKKMPDRFKYILISGKGILLDTRMVLCWIKGTLDANNSFLFENGSIFVTEEKKNISGTGIVKENINLKKDILKVREE